APRGIQGYGSRKFFFQVGLRETRVIAGKLIETQSGVVAGVTEGDRLGGTILALHLEDWNIRIDRADRVEIVDHSADGVLSTVLAEVSLADAPLEMAGGEIGEG